MANITAWVPLYNDTLMQVMAQAISRKGEGYYVISGCDVTEHTPNSMELIVDAGVCMYGGVQKTVSGNHVTTTSDGSYPRISTIYLDSTPTAQCYAGTPGSVSPVGETSFRKMETPKPGDSCPTGVILAIVYIATGATTLTNAVILDVAQYDHQKAVYADGTIPLTGNWDVGTFEIRANTFQSDVATGTAPFIVASTTKVTNLNAETIDGHAPAGFVHADGSVALSAAWDAGGYEIRSNTFQSDVATGTAPFIVASTTQVANLNAASAGNAATLNTYADTAFVKHALSTAENDFLVGGTGGTANTFVKKTLAETNTILKIPAKTLRKATFLIGDGSAVITTGIKGGFEIPVTGQITAARVMSLDATSGAIAIAVWQEQYADGVPTDADEIDIYSIAASGTQSEETGLTLAVTVGDWLTFNVDSVTSMKCIALCLTITPTA
jgi:hypothetical protein